MILFSFKCIIVFYLSFSPAFHTCLCLCATCTLLIRHLKEMCAWQQEPVSDQVLFECLLMKKAQFRMFRKIHSWEEWKQRYATWRDWLDTLHTLQTEMHTKIHLWGPASKDNSYKITVFVSVFSHIGRELLFRSDEMNIRTMFCLLQSTVSMFPSVVNWRGLCFSLNRI